MLEPANDETATKVPAPRAARTPKRYDLVRKFDDRLSDLDHCERCQRDADEKCVDRWLSSEGTFSIADVTCGCGCWTRTAYRIQWGLDEEECWAPPGHFSVPATTGRLLAEMRPTQAATDIRPSDLPEIRAHLIEWMSGTDAVDLWQAADDQGFFRVFDRLSEIDPDQWPYKDRAGFLRQLEIGRLGECSLFYVSADMTALAVAAARSIPDFRLAPEDLPAETGLMVFEQSIVPAPTEGHPDAEPLGVTAVCWGPSPNGDCLFMTPYHDRDAAIRALDGIEHGRPLASEPRLSYGFVENIWPFGDNDDVSPKEAANAAQLIELVSVLRAAWLLMRQTLSVTSDIVAPRPARRRLQRAGHEPRPVRLIELRRPRGGAGLPGASNAREYHHQWIVRGHWRQQWYPAREVHRPVWIAPHIKGPEDAPLIGGEKVNVWKR